MRVALVALLAMGSAGALHGQGIEGQVGRFYDETGWTIYRLGVSRGLTGPLSTALHAEYMERVGGEGAFAGLGLDLTAFRGGQGPYLVAGLGGGLASPHSNDFSSYWGSWSAGAGYDLVPASFLRVGFEGRWRAISLDHRNGLELAAGLSIGAGGRKKSAPAPSSAVPVSGTSVRTTTSGATPRIGAASALADSVVATATQAVGRPYRYGGTGTDGGGFDCSGLIQYAYAHYGISLPRQSTDQAKEGREIRARLDSLQTGDILTFSSRGGPVTHVGLYIGQGRFIHSASAGVQVSTLSPDDPYGRWWYARWVGARRILE